MKEGFVFFFFLVIQIIMLVSTPDFSEAFGCPPAKKGSGRWSTGGMLLSLPRQGTPQFRKVALITAVRGTQANILSLELPPGQTPSLGFEADGSEHCLVTFQKVQKIPLNPRPQRGCLAEEILVPDYWTGPLKTTFFPLHKCLP